MELTLHRTRTPAVRALEIEVVERKGRGHPDSLCDALSEELSRALCRFYLERFGEVLHHNVDKALLFAGAARPELGGGRVLAPMRLYLVGRAVLEHRGVAVPIDALAAEATATWVRANMKALDPDSHMEIRTLVRPGSVDLAELFLRQERRGAPLANDTSIGVGYAPMSELERVVAHVEETLNDRVGPGSFSDVGEDIKVMGIRRGDRISLTVASAMLGGRLPDLGAYLDAKDRVRAAALDAARSCTASDVSVEVNTADDPTSGSIYITVTGTSAEAGDDGQAGRGNRANGLITPYRLMTLESTAGKNPVSHVGKLYQIAAQRIAEALVAEIAEAASAECLLVSRIGHPIDDPQIVDIAIELEDRSSPDLYSRNVEVIVRRELDRLRVGWRELASAPRDLPAVPI